MKDNMKKKEKKNLVLGYLIRLEERMNKQIQQLSHQSNTMFRYLKDNKDNFALYCQPQIEESIVGQSRFFKEL